VAGSANRGIERAQFAKALIQPEAAHKSTPPSPLALRFDAMERQLSERLNAELLATISAGFALVSCSEKESAEKKELEKQTLACETVGQALLDTAEACVLSVRDHAVKYEQASECIALKALSGRYIDLSVQMRKVPVACELLFAKAQRAAWAALATSVSGGGLLRIW
jgi:hypothetical protein